MRAITLILLTITIASIVATTYTLLPSRDKGDLELVALQIKEAIKNPGRHIFYTKYNIFFQGDRIVVTDGERFVEVEVEGINLVASSGTGYVVLYINRTHAWLANAYSAPPTSPSQMNKEGDEGRGSQPPPVKDKPKPPQIQPENCEVMVVEKFCTQSFPPICTYRILSTFEADRFEVVKSGNVYKTGVMVKSGNYWSGVLNTQGLEAGLYTVNVLNGGELIGSAPLYVAGFKSTPIYP